MKTLLAAHRHAIGIEQEFFLLYRKSQAASLDFVTEYRRVRKEKNISLRAAAKTLRISAPYLSDIELNRRPPNRALRERMIKQLV